MIGTKLANPAAKGHFLELIREAKESVKVYKLAHTSLGSQEAIRGGLTRAFPNDKYTLWQMVVGKLKIPTDSWCVEFAKIPSTTANLVDIIEVKGGGKIWQSQLVAMLEKCIFCQEGTVHPPGSCKGLIPLATPPKPL